jgi:hypothetical protein
MQTRAFSHLTKRYKSLTDPSTNHEQLNALLSLKAERQTSQLLEDCKTASSFTHRSNARPELLLVDLTVILHTRGSADAVSSTCNGDGALLDL